MPGSTVNPLLFLASGVSDVQVRGLRFTGAGSAMNSNTLAVVYRSSRVRFDKVTVADAAGIGIVFSTEVSSSGVSGSSFVNVGSRWKGTGLRRDQHQGVVFCCGKGNHDNFVKDSSFEDVGLDAISFADQKDFAAAGNHSLNVGAAVAGVVGAALPSGVPVRDLVGGAAVYGAASDGAKVLNNVTDGAGGNGIDLFTVNRAEIIGNTARRSGGNGIGFAAGSNAHILRNVGIDNNQARLSVVSAPQAGIFMTGGRNGQPPVSRVTISGNVATDDQTTKTQNYGIQLQDGSVASDIVVEQSNRLSGNAISEFGEGAARFKPH
jgi:hypothetical protein